MNRNYWGYRIDTSSIDYFAEELEKGTLRQGWGYDIRQDLKNFTLDEGAKRNFVIKEKVQKGDILLVPRLPEWGLVAIVEATEDFDKGYSFEIDPEKDDYGHCFPAKKIGEFSRNNRFVSGNIRSTLRTPSRFWNINHYAEDVEKLLNQNSEKLIDTSTFEEKFKSIIKQSTQEAFDKNFENNLIQKIDSGFQAAEWEYILCEGLKAMFPNYIIENVGGKKEELHGTDILIKIPSFLKENYFAIAIQVKDYYGEFNIEMVKEQIKKADEYWQNIENLNLIEKWIFVTNSARIDSTHNENLNSIEELKSKHSDVKILFKEEFRELLFNIAKSIAGINLEENN